MALPRHPPSQPQPPAGDGHQAAAAGPIAPCASRWKLAFFSALLLGAASATAWSADTHATNTVIRELKKLSLEELMRVKVITASKGKKERSAVTFPAAAFVIPLEEVHSSDVTNWPEAPALASGLAVAGVTRGVGVHGGPWPDWPARSRLLLTRAGRTTNEIRHTV